MMEIKLGLNVEMIARGIPHTKMDYLLKPIVGVKVNVSHEDESFTH